MRGLNRRCVMAVMFMVCSVVVPLTAQTDGGRSFPADLGVLAPPIAESLLNPVLNLRPPVFYGDHVVTQPAGPPPTPRHTGIRALPKGLITDLEQLPSRENLLWAGVGGGLALAVHPLDGDVNHKLVGNSTAEHMFKAGEIL